MFTYIKALKTINQLLIKFMKFKNLIIMPFTSPHTDHADHILEIINLIAIKCNCLYVCKCLLSSFLSHNNTGNRLSFVLN